MIYVPKDLAEDGMFPFPFKGEDLIYVKVS